MHRHPTEPLPERPSRGALLACLGGVLALGGCSTWKSSDTFMGLLNPYRMEVVQGNVLTSEQLARVRPGMPRAQVRDLLGAPLLTSMFHADRWDYIFTMKRQGTEPQRRSVVVFFDGNVVKSINAPELPTEAEFVASITTARQKVDPPVLELTEAQKKALPVPAPVAAAASAAEPTGPLRDYPPLEPR